MKYSRRVIVQYRGYMRFMTRRYWWANLNSALTLTPLRTWFIVTLSLLIFRACLPHVRTFLDLTLTVSFVMYVFLFFLFPASTSALNINPACRSTCTLRTLRDGFFRIPPQSGEILSTISPRQSLSSRRTLCYFLVLSVIFLNSELQLSRAKPSKAIAEDLYKSFSWWLITETFYSIWTQSFITYKSPPPHNISILT